MRIGRIGTPHAQRCCGIRRRGVGRGAALHCQDPLHLYVAGVDVRRRFLPAIWRLRGPGPQGQGEDFVSCELTTGRRPTAWMKLPAAHRVMAGEGPPSTTVSRVAGRSQWTAGLPPP